MWRLIVHRILQASLLVALISMTVLPPALRASAQGPTFQAEINKSFTPLNIASGGVSRLRVSVFNTNTFAVDNAAWSDNLVGVQPGIFIANPVGLTNTCGGTVTAVSGATTLSLSGGSIPAQTGITPGSCYVEINVSSTTSGNLVNTIPVGGLTGTGGGGTISNTTPASATLRVNVVNPPTVAKGFTPNTIYAGGTSTLAITIRNTDLATTLTQTRIADNLPANVVVSGLPATPLTNCGAGATLTAVTGSGSITLTNASIPPNSDCVVRVVVTSATSGIYTNAIPSNAVTTQQGVTNANPANADLNVQDVAISKVFNPNAFQAGGTSTLTITITNPSNRALTGATLTDNLPGTVLTAVAGSGATTCGAGTVTITPPRQVTLNNGTVPAAVGATPGSCTITVNVTAPAGAASASYTNTIGARTLTTNELVTNVLPATSPIRIYAAGTGITAAKSFSPATISAGQNSRLRINITAPADTNLTNFSVTDTLPAGVIISNSIAPTFNTNCGAATLTATTNTNVITLTGATIPAGQQCRIEVYVTSAAGGTYDNIIPATNFNNNENRRPGGPVASTLTVQILSDLVVDKGFTPSTVAPNGISTLTITLTNNNTSPLINVSVTDPLPFVDAANGVFVAPTPNLGTTCGSGTVSVTTAANGSQSVVLTGGTVPATVGTVPGLCTITVNVQGRSATGTTATRTNTIPITNVTGTIQSSGTTIQPATPATANLVITNIAIGVIKGFSPLTVFGGSASTVSIQFVNSGTADLAGVQMADNMPAGMIIANPPNFNTGTCGGTITGTPGTSTFSYSGGALAAGTTCTITASITMTVNANLTNIIPTGAVTTLNGASNTQPAEATLTNLPGASISKVFLGNPITNVPGNYSQLEITIRNTGNTPITGMGLIDNLPGILPAGLFIAASPAPGNTCNGTLTAVPGTQFIQLVGGTMPGNATCALTIPVAGTVPGSYTNNIPTNTLTNDQGASNSGPATDTLVVNAAPPELGVAKRVVNPPVLISPGVWDVTYAILAQNYGGVALDNLQIVDDLVTTFGPPATFTVRSITSPTLTVNPAYNGASDTKLLAGTDSLALGASGAVQIVVRVSNPAATTYLNTATGTATGSGTPVTDTSQDGNTPDSDGDGNPGNNDGPTSVTFGTALIDIPMGVKLVDPARLPSLRWTVIWINNNNTVPITTSSSDPIPAGTAFVNNGVPSGYALPAGTLPAGSLASGVVCEDTSTITTTTTCYYEGPTTAYPRGRIVWSGVLGPDNGVTDPANTLNEIRISFNVKVDPGVKTVRNTATIDLDRNGDGDFTDTGESNVASAAAGWDEVIEEEQDSGGAPSELPVTGFAPGRVTHLPEQPASLAYTASDGMTLEIPALKVKAPVVGVPRSKAGWKLDWLENQVGYLEGTAFPTWNGNSVLTAHVYDANGNPGPFVDLSKLTWGNKIVIVAWGQKYTYEVRSVRTRVSPTDTRVLKHEEKPWLTLITCQGYDEKSDSYRWRVVVKAVLVSIE